MVDTTNLIGSIAGIAQQFQAASMINSAAQAQAQSIRIGGDIAAQGSLLTAQGYRYSAQSVADATKFNLAIDKTNLQRQLKATSRQFSRLIGQQLSSQAASGANVGSKSFLQLRNEALDVYGTALLNLKIDAENTRRAKLYESQVKQVNLENQARAAEYNAQVERVMASNRAAEAAYQGEVATFKAGQSALKAVPTVLSQIYQG